MLPGTNADANDQVLVDASPCARVYKSGRVERLTGTAVVPPGLDPATGVASKDVLIDPETGLSARLYLPPRPADCALPVLVYFHGGSFIVETAASPIYHNYLNSLAAAAGSVAVSVDYRRAPEHPLPGAYDDSWVALRWVAARSPEEAWLAVGRADLGRLFLAGDSAGANIVYHIAMRAAEEGLGGGGAAIRALVLVHPYFWGAEGPGHHPGAREMVERMWAFARQETVWLDSDPWINPLVDGARRLAALPCLRVLVVLAEDMLRDKGLAFWEALRGSGWEGEARLVESEGEEHLFHLYHPEREKAVALLGTVAAFLTSDCGVSRRNASRRTFFIK